MKTILLALLAAGLGLAAIGGVYGADFMQNNVWQYPEDSIIGESTRCYYEVLGNGTMHHSMQYTVTNNSTLTMTGATLQTQLVRTDTGIDNIWVIDERIDIAGLWPGQSWEGTAEINTERIDGEFECRVHASNVQFNLIQDVLGLQGEIKNLKAENSDMKDTIADLEARLAAIEDGSGTQPEPDPPEPTGILAGKVYEDINGNGIFDAGEPGMLGRTVISVHMHYEPNQRSTWKATTDANGDYSMEDIPAGTYRISVQGTHASTNADVLQDQQTTLNLPGPWWGVQGKVYQDANYNERFDEGDPVAQNRLLIIRTVPYDGSNHGEPVIVRTTTDANGDYSQRMIPPPYYDYPDDNNSFLWAGTNEAVSQISLGIGTMATHNIVIANRAPPEPEPRPEPQLPGILKGKVYWDENNNGEPDGGEGLHNWLVIDHQSSCLTSPLGRSTTTDANGDYLFEFETAHWGERPCVAYLDASPDFGLSGERILLFKNTTTVKHLSLEFEPCSYAGFPFWIERPCGQSTSSGVKGKIYTDTNNNNRLDPGERGRAGIEVITVSLTDHSDVERLRTDANGDYSFELSAGGYLVQAIGGGPNSYAYVTIPDGTMLVRNLAY